MAESNEKGHAGASIPAGFLTQHNPGVIKHGKKKKGARVGAYPCALSPAPRGPGYSEVPAALDLWEPGLGSLRPHPCLGLCFISQ